MLSKSLKIWAGLTAFGLMNFFAVGLFLSGCNDAERTFSC